MEINKEAVIMVDSFKKLSESIRKMFDCNIFDSLDLSVSELKILETIQKANEENKLMNTSEVASNLRITKSAVSQSVSKLEKKGYLRKKISIKDKKIGYLYLTESSKNIYEEKKKKCELIIEKVIGAFGEEKILSLSNLLSELSEVIENIRREKVC